MSLVIISYPMTTFHPEKTKFPPQILVNSMFPVVLSWSFICPTFVPEFGDDQRYLFEEMEMSPDTSSFFCGLAVPIPTFPPFVVIPAVLASKSRIPSTIRFHFTEESASFEEVLSDIEIPPLSAAYPTESMTAVPKKTNPDSMGFLISEIRMEGVIMQFLRNIGNLTI